MRTLLIDNYDSFTYNLFQLLAEANGAEPIVVRNDEASWAELARLGFDNVVISPGPGRPDRARDFGVCAEVIRRCEAPLLGVCLGHQGLGWVHGGRVEPAPEPLHGRVRTVEHTGSPLFAGIPARFQAVRYHSLCLAQPLPAALEPLARAEDGVVMAVAHRTRPQWGVQFHPESVATEHGARLLENFRDLTATSLPPSRRALGGLVAHTATKSPSPAAPPPLELKARRLDHAVDAERAFVALYGESPDSFWLDSSRPGAGARFSFMGDAAGPLAATVTYDVEAGEVRVERGGAVEVRGESIFDYLRGETGQPPVATTALPFDFDCGFVGYLGYELKADCGGVAAHRSGLPDAALLFADRVVAFDHERGDAWLLCLAETGRGEGAEAWLDATASRLAALGSVPPPDTGDAALPAVPARAPVEAPAGAAEFRLRRSRRRYLEDVAACMRKLREGESYEVCLTNAVEAEAEADPLDLYRRLRRVNPAPFSAYLRCGGRAVLSSSPERFLRVDGERRVEAKPIKGTSRRGDTPAEDALLARQLREDEKSRAENLMIADLLRNDLGSVCEVGSVEVPALIEVESYATVHQLVSTVRGRLREGLTATDAVRACFPPGSMTGAPKLRTMEILDELEGEARGVYSGAIGYLGRGGGCDLSVVIRAIVLDGGAASVGAGGAIVMGSDPEREYGEMLLKAAAPLRAIEPGLDPASISLTDPRPVAVHSPPASAHDLTS